MKKLMALYPNITLEENFSLWSMDFKGLDLDSKGKSLLVACNYKNQEEEKSCNRQVKILHGHLMTACFLKKLDPLVDCAVINNYIEGDEVDNKGRAKVSFNSLLEHMPKELEETSKTTTWFSLYLSQSKKYEHNRVIRLYNALGTLPCGFKDIVSISSNDKEQLLLEKMLIRVEDLKVEYDDDDEDYTPKSVPFTMNEIEELEKIYVNSLLKFYPVLK